MTSNSMANDKKMMKNPVLEKAGEFTKNYTIVIALVGLVVVLSFVSPNFLTETNLVNLLKQTSVIGLLSFGMTYVMIFGGVDLSIGATATLSGLCTVYLLDVVGMFPAILIALCLGAGIGLVNGLILSFIRGDISANFIVTLGTMTFMQAIALIVTGGAEFYANKQVTFKLIGQGVIGAIPISTIILIVAGVILQIILSNTGPGRRLYMSGGNRIAASYAGVKINRSRIMAFIVSGICAAAAGVVLSSRVGGANPNAGKGLEFDAIAAIVIGGNSMFGGRGTIYRTAIGVLVIVIISNALNLLSIPSELQTAVRGVVILLSVWVDVKRNT